MTKLLFLSLLIFATYSCNNNLQKEKISSVNEKRIIQLKSNLFGLSEEREFKNFTEFKNGYSEDFKNNEENFRLVIESDTSHSFELQVENEGKWETKLKLPLKLSGYNLITDWDKDGLKDLTKNDWDYSRIYLYDKYAKTFLVEPIEVPYDCVLLDENRVIYGSNNKIGDIWDVEIFSLIKKQKYYYYKVRINTVMEAYYRMINSTIYECKNGNLSDTILFKKEKLPKNMMLNRYMKNLMNIK